MIFQQVACVLLRVCYAYPPGCYGISADSYDILDEFCAKPGC